MLSLTKKEKNIIEVIIKFHILTGVFPTVDQLAAITGYSPTIIVSMVIGGYVITEESNNPGVIKFKKA